MRAGLVAPARSGRGCGVSGGVASAAGGATAPVFASCAPLVLFVLKFLNFDLFFLQFFLTTLAFGNFLVERFLDRRERVLEGEPGLFLIRSLFGRKLGHFDDSELACDPMFH